MRPKFRFVLGKFMQIIDNINRLLGDDLKQTLKSGARLKIAASCFSMYAFEALKTELEEIDELRFIFTSPTFVANEVTDKVRKERKKFHIPKAPSALNVDATRSPGSSVHAPAKCS